MLFCHGEDTPAQGLEEPGRYRQTMAKAALDGGMSAEEANELHVLELDLSGLGSHGAAMRKSVAS